MVPSDLGYLGPRESAGGGGGGRERARLIEFQILLLFVFEKDLLQMVCVHWQQNDQNRWMLSNALPRN
jgi:hypothetical protein